jgi:hypothetical protein
MIITCRQVGKEKSISEAFAGMRTLDGMAFGRLADLSGFVEYFQRHKDRRAVCKLGFFASSTGLVSRQWKSLVKYWKFYCLVLLS